MATPTLVQSAKTTATASGTIAFPSNVTAGNFLHIMIRIFDASQLNVNTPTDTQSNTWKSTYGGNSSAGSPATVFNSGVANTQRINEFWTHAASSGACTVSFSSTTATLPVLAVTISEWTGIPSVQAFSEAASASSNTGSSGTADSGNITLDAGTYLLIGTVGGTNHTGITANNSFTILQNEAGSPQVTTAYRVVTGPGTFAANFTLPANQRWGCRVSAWRTEDTNIYGFTAPTFSTAATDSSGSAGIGGQPWNVSHQAIWDSASGTTGRLICSYQRGTGTHPTIAYYDNNSATWSQVSLGTSGSSDDHNQLVIVTDDTGKYHVFGACHDGPLRHWISNSAHDPTAWTELGNTDSVASYPNAYVFSDGAMIIFYRTGGHVSDWAYRISTDDGATWGSETSFITGTGNYAWYLSSKQNGDDVYIDVIWEDHNNTNSSPAPDYKNRYGHYLFKLNWNGSAISATNMAGSSQTIPLTNSTLTANCTVEAAAFPEMTYNASLDLGSDGYPAILYTNARGLGSHFLYFKKWNGSSWNTRVLVTMSGFDCSDEPIALFALPSNTWIAYVNRLGTNNSVNDYTNSVADRGGEIHQYKSTDNGSTWVFQGVCKTGNLQYVIPVIGSGSPFTRMTCDTATLGSTTGNLYAFNDPTIAAVSKAFAPTQRRMHFWRRR